ADTAPSMVEQRYELATRYNRHGEDAAGCTQHAWHDQVAVETRPPVERLRVSKDRQVVHGHDQRDAGPHRASIRRAVKHVGRLLAAEDERVPDSVTRQGRKAVASPERASRHVDVVATPELAQQPVQVTGGTRPGLDERR